eukprot:7364397-Heterocapsa_arctica.AAC.1
MQYRAQKWTEANNAIQATTNNPNSQQTRRTRMRYKKCSRAKHSQQKHRRPDCPIKRIRTRQKMRFILELSRGRDATAESPHRSPRSGVVLRSR